MCCRATTTACADGVRDRRTVASGSRSAEISPGIAAAALSVVALAQITMHHAALWFGGGRLPSDRCSARHLTLPDSLTSLTIANKFDLTDMRWPSNLHTFIITDM